MNGVDAVQRWLTGQRCSDDFPYRDVVASVREHGKHFVPPQMLEVLGQAREVANSVAGPDAGGRLLRSFLNVLLDKADGRYDYRTYLALELLPLPDADRGDIVVDAAAALRYRDRLVVALIADVLRFEHAAAEDRRQPLPELRPAPGLTRKRLRLGMRVLQPALARLGLEQACAVDDVRPDRLWRAVEDFLDQDERQAVALSMLPVSRVHDEYLFLRVLQSWEATFALVAVDLCGVIQLLGDGHAVHGGARLDAATGILREASPLFSLLATMQVAAFRDFRRWTEGASAIQSYSYKLVESLCRRPELARLHSVAFQSAPQARMRALSGQATVQSQVGKLERAGFAAVVEDQLVESMASFAAALTGWRRTHYSLAVRMLGNEAGTGYTSGTAYLKEVKDIPVFNRVPSTPSGARRDRR
ncbi:tryptophan 2,3-dioxygenase family protein [Micromonospora chalcea]|uniref:tryptophan 2,3-dioxygenase family protein n=1 Tax=Micromonospora chalcea TaxID=1874 RepID=UPI00382DB96A